jgi:DnaJ like chaperone protein
MKNQYMGKLVGGLIGFLTLGPLGLLLGLWVGHAFDKGLGGLAQFASPEFRAKIQESFFTTTFRLLGCLAKADGRVSESEIAHAEALISQMGLDTRGRQRAIALFKEGSSKDFELEVVVNDFLGLAGRHPQLKQTLLLFLISMALADGTMDPAERNVLDHIGRLLGFSEAQVAHLLRMAQAQGRFHETPGSQGTVNDIQVAYDALGVQQTASDAEVKRAYRKLMSENHPDKLIAKGVPDSMVKLATEKSQEIQAAYELIKKQRAKV